ncbi:MAG: hypothetical protein V8Q36_00985 [Anaerotignum sp.]
MIEKYIIVLLIVIGFEALLLCIAWEEIKALQQDKRDSEKPLLCSGADQSQKRVNDMVENEKGRDVKV